MLDLVIAFRGGSWRMHFGGDTDEIEVWQGPPWKLVRILPARYVVEALTCLAWLGDLTHEIRSPLASPSALAVPEPCPRPPPPPRLKGLRGKRLRGYHAAPGKEGSGCEPSSSSS